MIIILLRYRENIFFSLDVVGYSVVVVDGLSILNVVEMFDSIYRNRSKEVCDLVIYFVIRRLV